MQSSNSIALQYLTKNAAAIWGPVEGGIIRLYNSIAKNDTQDKELVDKLIKSYGKTARIPDIEVTDDPSVKGNALYYPYPYKIQFSKETIDNPGFVAHELGHAQDYGDPEHDKSLWRRIARYLKMEGYQLGSSHLGYWGLTATALAALLTKNVKLTGGLAAATALTQLPRLRNEIVASQNGYKMLREQGVDKKKAFKMAYNGVPTYAILPVLSTLPVLYAALSKKK